jgi:hypothetical protein
MADNFNLRSFLTENNLTKNAQLLKEQEEDYKYFDEEGTGGFYMTTIDGVKIYSLEDSSIMDTCFYALEGPETTYMISVDVSGEQVDADYVEQDSGVTGKVADFIVNDINSQLEEEDLDEEATQGTDISGYWVMYGGLNKGIKEFIKMFPSQEEAQQALEDAPTTYGQHVLRGYWGIIPAQEWLASGGEIGPNQMGHPDRVVPKRLSPEERQAIRQLDFDAEMEREGTQNKKPIMKETNLTAKERRLVEMVNNAMGYQEEEEDGFNPADAADEEDYRRDQYQGNQMEEGDEMADETVIPEYNTIDELMNSIDHGTNKVAEEHKMQEMKKIAEALRMKAKKMEESEHAAHISPKDLKQLANDAAKLEKAAEKLKAAFDKKFNKKEKAPAAPKAEKVEALQEGFFDLRKFLAENRK